MWKHRNVTPSSFGLAIFCFLLPWIEIRCDSPRGGAFSGQGIDTICTTQTGLQLCYGGTTTTINHQPLTPEQQLQADRQKGTRSLAAPAMWLYAVALLAGLTASLSLNKPGLRFRVVIAAGSVALLVLIGQLAIGFPIVEGVPRRQNNNGWSYTIWFWLGLVSTMAALASVIAQRLAEPRLEEETASDSDKSTPSDQNLTAEDRSRLRHRIVVAIATGLACLLLLMTALFIWPGFARGLPSAGIAMSGYTDYMLSDEHIGAVKLGMSLQEVATVLDIAQEKLQPERYIMDLDYWHKDRQKVGAGNLENLNRSLEIMASQKEYWFHFGGSSRTLSLRIKNGQVVEIKDSRSEVP